MSPRIRSIVSVVCPSVIILSSYLTYHNYMDQSIELATGETINLTDLINIVVGANKEALTVYHRYLNTNNLVVKKKSDDSPVTQADIVVSKYLAKALNDLYPNIPIVCEESSNADYEIRKSYRYYWCIDPIDGTKEFLKKNGEFTINVALIKGTRPILGIVSCPPQDTIYFASVSNGAYKLNGSELEAISCRVAPKIPIVVISGTHSNPETTDYLSRFKKHISISRGSSLKFLEVAEGKADYYPRLTGSMEWDTAASNIIVLEAGGNIRLLTDPNKTLVYNKCDLLNPFFVVSGLT